MEINWVKRIGQAHHSKDGKTLCGMPCLGSNYVNVIAEKHWKICEKCKEVSDGQCNEGRNRNGQQETDEK